MVLPKRGISLAKLDAGEFAITQPNGFAWNGTSRGYFLSLLGNMHLAKRKT
jgi:hypothetical protein